jgi:hypothetical protein
MTVAQGVQNDGCHKDIREEVGIYGINIMIRISENKL